MVGLLMPTTTLLCCSDTSRKKGKKGKLNVKSLVGKVSGALKSIQGEEEEEKKDEDQKESEEDK
jgi:hypothetical protein